MQKKHVKNCFFGSSCKPLSLVYVPLFLCIKGAIIQSPGEGGSWSFCRGQIIYFNPVRQRAENCNFYYIYILTDKQFLK